MTKLPPHSIEFEQTVLSSILFNSENIDEAHLLPADFYRPAHSMIFQAILELRNRDIAIDIASVVDMLQKKSNLEVAGGAIYVSQLLDQPISGNIEYHCSRIKQYANLRKLIEISSNTIQSCYDTTQDPTDVIENTQKEISEINSENTGVTYIGDILNDTVGKLEELQKNGGGLSGVGTGFRALDGLTSGLQNGDFILLGARPSMGKTAFAMNIVKYAAKMFDPVLVFSLEMPKEHLTNRLLSDMASINGMKFQSGKFSTSEWKAVNRASSALYDLPIHIVDTPGLNINQVLSISRKFVRKHKIKLIMIDYIQLIQGWNNEGQGAKAEISRSIKLLAKSLSIPVIGLSQLNRSLETRNNKRPIMSDLREAGALEQDADVIAFLYRDEVYNKDEHNPDKGIAELIIRKNRQGGIGMIKLAFQPEYTRFSSLEREQTQRIHDQKKGA